jgi:DNA repair exonuclease SbcCD nuclease subunit
MKVVLFSDLHLDATFAWMGGTPDARRRRRDALRTVLQRVAELAREKEADALLCAGDLFDRYDPRPDTAAFVRRVFEELAPIRVFIAPGNHDWYGEHSFYARPDLSPNVYIFKEARLTPIRLNGSVTLWGAAHRAPANTNGFFESGFRADGPGVHLALFHGSERGWFSAQGKKEPHAPFDEHQIGAAGLHHAFVGHYHNPKAGEYHTYPGNPEPLAFGETGERGAVIITLAPTGEVAEREWVRVAVTPVHEIEVDLTGCEDRNAVQERVADTLNRLEGIVRLRLVGELEESVQMEERDITDIPHGLEALKADLSGLRVAYDFDHIAQEPTVRGEFVRDVTGAAELSEMDKRRILVAGLRALDGRYDLEVP